MLGPGEVLDRAVALYVRNFWHLVTIVAMTSMPIAIASVIDSPHSIVTSLTDGHLFGPRDPKTPSTSALEYGLIGLGILASFFGGTACEIAADARYRQRSLPLLYVYGQALRRCIAQFVAFLPPAALYAALIITLFAAASTISRAFGSSAAPVWIGLALFVLALTLGSAALFVYFAAQVAFVTVALDDANPLRAIWRSFRRVFG